MALQPGDRCPDVELPDDSGKMVKLSFFFGRPFIVYFYPKDDTPGCTAEACSFRDGFAAYRKIEVPVIGISMDPPESHQRFKERYGLPFTLLSDQEAKAAKAFGVYRCQSLFGPIFGGVARATFLVDKKGTIAFVFSKVDCGNHAAEVLDEVERLD